jgi:2-polyprenyl-3-methyl-5-hydroxy-6-metoxy-1,4-benzoquinol methylase
MEKSEYSERQKRGKEFYEEYSKRQPIQEVSFDPILGKERRNWNLYWFVYEFALTSFKNKNQKLLDFGCGSGIASIQVAENLNYPNDFFDIVVGIDILHHVEIKLVINQCFRVLKYGGVAIFKEIFDQGLQA